VLIIDEIGYLEFDKAAAWKGRRRFDPLAARRT